jgi:hypothetical protein
VHPQSIDMILQQTQVGWHNRTNIGSPQCQNQGIGGLWVDVAAGGTETIRASGAITAQCGVVACDRGKSSRCGVHQRLAQTRRPSVAMVARFGGRVRNSLSITSHGRRRRHCVAAALDSAAPDAGSKRAVSLHVLSLENCRTEGRELINCFQGKLLLLVHAA